MADGDVGGSLTPQVQPEPPGLKPPATPAIHDVIGQGLRVMYDSFKAEPIPEHLLELIEKLDKPKQDGVI